MNDFARSPFLVFWISLVVLWLSARLGASLRKGKPVEEDARQDLDLIVPATLTLLGLVIGFSFSMAINRYDQRKAYEEAEANAIGTECLRADLLPPNNAERVRVLLRNYLDQRILFYQTRDLGALRRIDVDTARLQTELWSAVRTPGEQPTPLLALVVSGMNDVLNSQGFTQAAWWNRIPIAAWLLMAAIGMCSNLLVGYGARRVKTGQVNTLVLPIVLSVAFFLIADIDSPRRGVIRVVPQNLMSLAESLPRQ
jgi:hypothetical protein